MTAKKPLPQKTCPTCGRPFNWRKKWQNCWDDVVHCSERCRRNRNRNRASDGDRAELRKPR